MIRTVYSSAGLAGNRRLAWQKVIREVYANLDIDIGPGETFSGRICRWVVGDAELTKVHTDNEFARRTARHIARGACNSYAYLFVRSGTLSISQGGRDCEVGPGQYTLLDLDRPYLFSHPDKVEKICLKAPAHLLRLRDAKLAEQCAVARSADAGLGRVAAHYISSLCAEDLEAMPEQLPALSRTAGDLLSLLFDSADAASLPQESSVQSALRRRSVAYIGANYSSADLSPAVIAEALGISVRYLHRCFEPMGECVMQHVTELRLANCHRELLDASLRKHSIAEIAYRNGFRNISHFSDSFRANFGTSARDIRATASRG